MATKNTERLIKKRLSEPVQQFKSDFENFLTKTGANEILAWHLKKDLSAKMDMPYYGDKEANGERTMTPLEVCIGFCELAISYDNKDFIKDALAWLCQQQGQSFRKISPQDKKTRSRIASAKQIIWEHSIPVNYTKNYVFKCICRNDIEEIKHYLYYLSTIPQVCMLKKGEEDHILKQYKDTMPEGWNYNNDSPYIRYILSGMNLDTLGLDNSRWE